MYRGFVSLFRAVRHPRELLQARTEPRRDSGEHSWRSRPPLAHYLNAVFTQAFSGEIQAARIKPQPARREVANGPTVKGHGAMDAAGLKLLCGRSVAEAPQPAPAESLAGTSS